MQHYYQFQVILKPSPDNVQDLYLDSLRAIGIPVEEHDVRFVEDDWESPTLGAWGLGWEVWIDGMEVTQFTYFQQVGGFECRPVPAEITYGLERLTMYIQGVDSVYDIVWSRGADGSVFTYGDVFLENEREFSAYNFEVADTQTPVRRVRPLRSRMQPRAGGRAAACGLRLRAEVQPRVQPARRARRDIGHRAHGLHPARARHREGVLRELSGTRGGTGSRRRRRRGRRGGCRRACRRGRGRRPEHGDEDPCLRDRRRRRLPAFDLHAATERLAGIMGGALDAAGVPHGDVETYSTPDA